MILLGDYTPAAASDYCLGTNHVLPTRGSARTFSGLSVLDYVKTVPIVECGKSALKQMLRQAETLSQREGLPNHYLALRERLFND
jgi:histidinol dehydrogenase